MVSRTFGYPTFNYASHGDFWNASAWSLDDNLYGGSNDSIGFSGACAEMPGGSGSVVANVFWGHPASGTVDGYTKTCNPNMPMGEGQLAGDWDNGNMVSVNGILYWSAIGYTAEWATGHATLLRSTDYGDTWCARSNDPADPCPSPVHDRGDFNSPGEQFGAPIFVDYGRDPGIKGSEDWPDGAQTYVFAMSSDFTNGGDNYYLGRVRRDQIDALDPADWQYVIGWRKTRSGKRTPIWGDRKLPKVSVFGMAAGNLFPEGG